ncbi:MAG: N-acetylmannosamine-6-phosphate 2-epimerase [Anaerolineae bacterium]|jgi:N-acylglucosamine-6-phosphate 2-epimerase|nr:N-acetylmannosamine-6-phosphate 2-epimerase [Anaerolineae bacterium]
MDVGAFLSRVRGQLIVSCQALPNEPLHGAQIMARMALAAQVGGAAGIRANSPADVRAIRQAVDLPLIGLYKDGDRGVYITPTIAHAVEVAEAGADVVALDATHRPRPNGDTLTAQIEAIHRCGKLALADVSTLDEALDAQEAGADLAAPTLSGYTDYSPKLDGPDYALIQQMVQALRIPVIAEGRIRTPHEARLALGYGAVAVVVGSAITRPQLITEQFVRGLTAVQISDE